MLKNVVGRTRYKGCKMQNTGR